MFLIYSNVSQQIIIEECFKRVQKSLSVSLLEILEIFRNLSTSTPLSLPIGSNKVVVFLYKDTFIW